MLKKASFRWYTPWYLCPIPKQKTKNYILFIEIHIYKSIKMEWKRYMQSSQFSSRFQTQGTNCGWRAKKNFSVILYFFPLYQNNPKWSKIFPILSSGWYYINMCHYSSYIGGIFQSSQNKKLHSKLRLESPLIW